MTNSEDWEDCSNEEILEELKKTNNYLEKTQSGIGKITNIDYQTNWILDELKKTNLLLDESIKVNKLILHLFEHMLEKGDFPAEVKGSVRMEMARGLRR